MWRYLELLPFEDPANIVSLTETITPILSAKRLGAEFGLEDLLIKDESRLPTGSFKARGMAMAVTMANELGLKRLAAPTAGNAGGALAAYAARAGMESWVFMPEDTPVINQKECLLHGANVFAVNGLIDDCGRLIREGMKEMGWFDVSTLKEPYRIEGKKTMGLELAEQFEWELARLDSVSDRRRHGFDRHVEGIRRIGGIGMAQERQTTEDGFLPKRWVRTDCEGF